MCLCGLCIVVVLCMVFVVGVVVGWVFDVEYRGEDVETAWPSG